MKLTVKDNYFKKKNIDQIKTDLGSYKFEELHMENIFFGSNDDGAYKVELTLTDKFFKHKAISGVSSINITDCKGIYDVHPKFFAIERFPNLKNVIMRSSELTETKLKEMEMDHIKFLDLSDNGFSAIEAKMFKEPPKTIALNGMSSIQDIDFMGYKMGGNCRCDMTGASNNSWSPSKMNVQIDDTNQTVTYGTYICTNPAGCFGCKGNAQSTLYLHRALHKDVILLSRHTMMINYCPPMVESLSPRWRNAGLIIGRNNFAFAANFVLLFCLLFAWSASVRDKVTSQWMWAGLFAFALYYFLSFFIPSVEGKPENDVAKTVSMAMDKAKSNARMLIWMLGLAAWYVVNQMSGKKLSSDNYVNRLMFAFFPVVLLCIIAFLV